jgi:hypothetical protein
VAISPKELKSNFYLPFFHFNPFYTLSIPSISPRNESSFFLQSISILAVGIAILALINSFNEKSRKKVKI